MVETKDKIIQQSVVLFNQLGVTTVSLRQIASALNISLGNLTYHYKNKTVIIGEIYRRMDEEMADAVFPSETEVDLHHYQVLRLRISDFQWRYRFFYMDILEIARRYPEVIRSYRKTIRTRTRQTQRLFQTLVEKDLIKAEETDSLYQTLSHAIWVTSTFWLQQKHILGPRHPAIQGRNDVDHIWLILRPYLTTKGRKQYRQINDHSSKREHVR